MRTLIKNGLVLQGKVFKYLDVYVKDSRIEKLCAPETPYLAVDETFDAKGKYITPGFIDIHTHGAVNEDINNTTAEGLGKIADFFLTQGVTTWLMSIVTDQDSEVKKAIENFNTYQARQEDTNLLGIHMEGPFLSKEFRGSMPEELLKEFNLQYVQQMNELAHHNIRYITVAPEVRGVIEGISALQKENIHVAIGHSGADYETTLQAVREGAESCTHIFNAMGLFHQHHPGFMGGVLESDMMYEAICDGRHLHPGTIRMLIKLAGVDRVITITDSIMATGLKDGFYKLGANEIVVKDGDAKLRYQDVRAGSTLTLRQALVNLLKFTDLSVGEILQMMTLNPAKLLKIDHEVGSIEEGKLANLLRIDLNGDLVDTWLKGKHV